MNCPACLASAAADARFCPACGAALSPLAAPATAGRPLPEEKELWIGRYSPRAMFVPLAAAGLLSLAVLVAGVVLSAQALHWLLAGSAVLVVWLWLLGTLLVRRFGIRYRLTNYRLIHERGILVRVVDRIELIEVDDVTQVQNLIERLLNVGTVRVTSSDQSHPVLLLEGIQDVSRVAELVDSTRRAERNRRGVHINAI